MRFLVFLAFFFSGFSSLVLENLWVHQLILVFGGTTLAITTVLTAFMGGLALGSHWGGVFTKRIKRPVLAYGVLEMGIASYAFLLPFVLPSLPSLYSLLPQESSFLGKSLLRFVLCLILLLLPTTLMGATLPVLSRYVTGHNREIGFDVGLLYSINTFGAVLGTLVGGFFLLPFLGHHRTLFWVAGFLFCLASALIVFSLLSTPSSDDGNVDLEHAALSQAEDVAVAAEDFRWLFRMCLAVTGGLAMSCQILWSRTLSMIVGSSTYSFTLILSLFLIGLAGGASIGAWWTKRTTKLVRVWVGLLLLLLFHLVGSLFLFDKLPLFFRYLFHTMGLLEQPIPWLLFSIKAFVIGVIILFPTLCMGTFFPIALSLSRSSDDVGKQVGKLYTWNTVGSILGSILTGFVCLPLFGLQDSLSFCVVLYAICVGLLLVAIEDKLFKGVASGVGVGLIVVALLLPRWQLQQLNAGYFRPTIVKQSLDGKTKPLKTLYYKEGSNATVIVQANGIHRFLRINGKVDASNLGDTSTQMGLAVFPLSLHPAPEDVLVIGWGSGMTVGSALQFPVRRVVALELEPAVLEASRFFEPWNLSPQRDHRLQVVFDDGRNFLSTTPRQFDVIISEPSNPWISGVANLFTLEFFQQVQKHLRAGGVFCQWLQSYELSKDNMFSVIRTVQKVFPHVLLFRSDLDSTDTLIFASQQPLFLEQKRIRSLFRKTRIRRMLHRMKIFDEVDFLFRYLLHGKQIERLFAGKKIPLNTDKHNRLQYFAPFDLMAPQKKSNASFSSVIEPYIRQFEPVLRFKRKPMQLTQHAAFWERVLKNFLVLGDFQRVEAELKRFEGLQVVHAFVPKMKALLHVILHQQGPVPKGKNVLVIEDGLKPSLQSMMVAYQKNKMEACQRVILPMTRSKNIDKHRSLRWFFIGRCFVLFHQYSDALFSFERYLLSVNKATSSTTKPLQKKP